MRYILSNPNKEYRNFIVSEMGPSKIGLERRIFNKLSKYEKLYMDNQNVYLSDKNMFDEIYNFISESVLKEIIPGSNEEESLGLNGVICL